LAGNRIRGSSATGSRGAAVLAVEELALGLHVVQRGLRAVVGCRGIREAVSASVRSGRISPACRAPVAWAGARLTRLTCGDVCANEAQPPVPQPRVPQLSEPRVDVCRPIMADGRRSRRPNAWARPAAPHRPAGGRPGLPAPVRDGTRWAASTRVSRHPHIGDCVAPRGDYPPARSGPFTAPISCWKVAACGDDPWRGCGRPSLGQDQVVAAKAVAGVGARFAQARMVRRNSRERDLEADRRSVPVLRAPPPFQAGARSRGDVCHWDGSTRPATFSSTVISIWPGLAQLQQRACLDGRSGSRRCELQRRGVSTRAAGIGHARRARSPPRRSGRLPPGRRRPRAPAPRTAPGARRWARPTRWLARESLPGGAANHRRRGGDGRDPLSLWK